MPQPSRHHEPLQALLYRHKTLEAEVIQVVVAVTAAVVVVVVL
jgi:hypothetical protein